MGLSLFRVWRPIMVAKNPPQKRERVIFLPPIARPSLAVIVSVVMALIRGAIAITPVITIIPRIKEPVPMARIIKIIWPEIIWVAVRISAVPAIAIIHRIAITVSVAATSVWGTDGYAKAKIIAVPSQGGKRNKTNNQQRGKNKYKLFHHFPPPG